MQANQLLDIGYNVDNGHKAICTPKKLQHNEVGRQRKLPGQR